MDSQFSDMKSSGIFESSEFKPLLEVRGNILKRLFFMNVVSISQSFYDDYVIWCNKNNKYIDFIQPLYCHLYCNGISVWKIDMYMKEISKKIEDYLNRNIGNLPNVNGFENDQVC